MQPIETANTIFFPAIRRAGYRHKLWLLTAGSLLFLLTVGVSIGVRSTATPTPEGGASELFGLDFIAFYTAGKLVNDGHSDRLYDLKAIKSTQDALAAEAGGNLGSAIGPWWNPPFYAWVFSPLARLPFAAATSAWIVLNIAAALVACVLLVRILPAHCGWRTWCLLPAMLVLSVPFIHAISHGQNACTTLLLVAGVVTLWRADRPMLAGVIAGLLAYKPQHAVVIGGVLSLCLGWRAMAGLCLTGAGLLLVNCLTLPGTLGAFLHQMPLNIAYVQEQCVYLWERHATFKAFWRLLLQGNAVGPTALAVSILSASCVAAVAVMLLRRTPLARIWMPFDAEMAGPLSKTHRDRLIAATMLAMPLLMPFYFDYDLLMLAVPAALLAGLQLRDGTMTGDARSDRVIRIAGPVLYAWLMLNADVAEHLRVNFAVPLLALLAGAVTLSRRPLAVVEAGLPATIETSQPLARAA